MNDEIKVHVVEFKDRKYLQMRYVDPITGRQVTRSTKATTQKGAERAAAVWQDELRNGRYHRPTRLTWAEFRERYETDVLNSLARSTDAKVGYVFDKLEAAINPQRLASLTAERLSHFQTKLRAAGLSERTLKSYLGHLASALRWAVKMGFIAKAPAIEMPRRAKGGNLMKGRPITGEEFDRMLARVPEVCRLGKPRKDGKRQPARQAEQEAALVKAWKFYLRGLWLSGLRLGESLDLWWDRRDRLCVDFDGARPMLWIPAALEKGNKDRLLPMAPEFAELLQAVPVEEQTGRVFKGLARRVKGENLKVECVSAIICEIGKKAGVKVNQGAKGVKYASAHDLRRSFGERWASRVMPAVLQELMRHEDIQTTLRFYVGRNAAKTADILWQAHEAAGGNTSGNTPRKQTAGTPDSPAF